MLEKYFKLGAVLERHRSGLLGPHLDSFVALSGDLGYPRDTVRRQCCVLRDCGRWLEKQGLGVSSLGDDSASRCVEDRQTHGNPLHGDEASTIRRFVEHLRDLGVLSLPEPEAACDASPSEDLLLRYTKFLLEERAVVQVTVDNYVPFARRFLGERFGDQPLSLRELRESDVTDFVLRWARSQCPGRAKLMVTALRSFCRFLLAHGEIDVDLGAAVPSVADWRLSTVPKYISQEDVGRVLGVCDRTTVVGRRDYAMLVLLARLGLRAGEVARLELDDIHWRTGELTVRGKGSGCDRLPLIPDVGEALADYLSHGRPECSTRRVFIRTRPPIRQIAGAGVVSTVVRRAISKAGVKAPTQGAHLLRHSLATDMLRTGASMGEIGEILRHRSPITTEIYAKVDFNALRRLAQPWPVAEEWR